MFLLSYTYCDLRVSVSDLIHYVSVSDLPHPYFLNTTTQITDFIAPTVLIMAIAYMTSTMFMDVFHMAVDTVIMCYITDEEQNNGRAVYAEPELSDFIHKNGKLSDDHKR